MVMDGATRSGGGLARILCAAVFAVQIFLPALHPSHGDVDTANAHPHGAAGSVDESRDGNAAASHDAQGCVLCAALAAGHASLAASQVALVLDAPARVMLLATAAVPRVAVSLTRAAPRGPPLLAS